MIRHARAPGLLAIVLAVAGCGGSSERAVETAPVSQGPWSTPVELPQPAPPAGAEVVASADGTAIAVWTERDGRTGRVLAAERDGDGRWAAGTPIADQSPFTLRSASVVVDPSGVATAAWVLNDKPQGAIFGFVQVSRRPPGGRWSEPVTLSRGTNGLIAPLLAVQEDGRVVVAWSGSERRNGSYFAQLKSASRSPEGRWTSATIAGSRPEPFSGYGALGAVPHRARTRLVWLAFSGRGGHGGVFSSDRGPDGRWSAPARISGGAERPNDLETAVGGDGTIVAAWTGEGRSVPLRLAVGRPAGGWSAPATVSPRGGYNREPQVAVGPRGAALVIFERWKGGAASSLLQVVRIDRAAQASRPVTLARREVPPAPAVGPRMPLPWQAAPALADDGRAVVAWLRPGTSDPSGTPTEAVVGRVTEPAARWRPVEEIFALERPVLGVTLASATGEDGRFAVRWDEPTSATASVARSSEREP